MMGGILLAAWAALCVSLGSSLCDNAACSPNKHAAVVSCSHAGLTSLPVHWPEGVIHVDVSYNQISSLWGMSSREVQQVRHLNLSHNLLQTVEPSVLSELSHLESLDLSYNQLTLIHPHAFLGLTFLRSLKLDHNQLQRNVSADTFQGLSGLQRLDVSNNQLSELLNGTFSSVHELTWLSMEGNHLEKLGVESLTGLGRLLFLDLSNNQLEMTSSVLPPGVFAPLSAVQELRLHLNDMRDLGEYPDRVFNDLPSLHTLVIDTFLDPYFGQDFAALDQLQTLDLSFNCKINHLTNQSFFGFRFSSLRNIKMVSCKKLLTVELCAFCNLPKLKTLQFTWARYMNPNVGLRALYGLQGQTMDVIDLSNNGIWMPDTFLVDKHSTQFLVNICVSLFKMDNTNLRRVETGSFAVKNSRFTECLEHFIISNNFLHGDTFEILRFGIFSHRLQTLQIQDQGIFSVKKSECILSDNCTHHYVSHVPKGFEFSFTITFPQSLVLCDMSAVFGFISPLPSNFTFHAESLRYLDLSYNGMAKCMSTLYGLERLETLKLNYNYCYEVSDTLLDKLVGLKHLGLSNFGAPEEFYMTRGRRFFQNVRRLEELDLSRNQLLHLPADMLQGQGRLTQLWLSGNRFQSVPVSLSHHDNLSSLDLSHNMLPALTVAERAAMDHLASHHPFRLRLRGNPLACTCASLDMVQWLGVTRVSLDGEGAEGNYSCTLETGEMSDTQRVLAAMLPHWRKCVGVQVLAVALGLFMTQLLLLVLTYVVYCHYPRLCYVWKVLRRHQLPNRLRDFTKDAYLVYADTTRDVMWANLTLRVLLRQHGPLRLLLPERELLPTMDRAENICCYIDTSWRTVLVVTEDFSTDHWASGYAVRQALRSITALTPWRVIVLLLQDPRVLPPMPDLQRLLPHVPPHHVIRAHPLAPHHHPAWKALADAIVGE
ncbi:toll-like receptor 2 type-2 [Babylonia areolata]|uniref:toll-like receptor 2 type-2 n=1 Tax=Babylonia areolata TaxID=304850 RepID=UPI003FD303BD